LSAASVAPSPTPSPSPVANPAPSELQGSWIAEVPGGSVSLLIEAGTYRIVRDGSSGSGLIDVVGSEISFHSSTLCTGTGTYNWALEGRQLTFTPVGTDPCGRSLVLVDVTYEK
jgi:hypothetical protein